MLLTDTRLVQLYNYWTARRHGRRMPCYADIDPSELSFVFGHLLVIAVETDAAGEKRFRFRLHGTLIAERAGYDMTGQYVDELPNSENRDWLLDRCRGMLESRTAYAGKHSRLVRDRRHRYEVLWLPLSDDGENVNVLLGALIYN